MAFLVDPPDTLLCQSAFCVVMECYGARRACGVAISCYLLPGFDRFFALPFMFAFLSIGLPIKEARHASCIRIVLTGIL